MLDHIPRDTTPLDTAPLDIASIDSHLSQQGHFCLIDWLLSQNQLHYADYEAWRYGQLDSLDDKLSLDQQALAALLANTAKHCSALRLSSEPQPFYRWDDQHRVSLIASKTPERHQQLTQHWLRPQDLPQLDLFMDNSALIMENELRDALSGRQFDHAESLLQRLVELNPAHQRLGAYQDLINYGQHMQANSGIEAQAIEAELQGLTQEVLPLAREVLTTQARDYLAFAWRRLADNLENRAFTAHNPELHRSFALEQIPDWPAVQQCLLQDTTLYQHPPLLERLATALQASHEGGKAQLLWCLLMELHTQYAEQAIERQRGQTIHQLWEDFWGFDDVWPSDYFSAFVLARQPGLIQHLETFAPLKFQASQAMIALLQCYLAGEDEIAARQRLQNISPALLRMYMEVRKR